MLNLITEHTLIVLAALILTVFIGVPLGILAYFFPKLRIIVIKIVETLQTIPAMATLGFMMVILGAGKPAVIFGLFLYSLLPVVQNTCLGLLSIDGDIKQVAKGMGMTRLTRLVWVELPIAIPMIITGVRIAAVNAVGTAVFASSVGGGGLGSLIFRGIRLNKLSLIASGTIALMLLTLAIDTLMSLIEKKFFSLKWEADK